MYFITLSRQLGTKGTEIAKLVAKELHYDFYDTEAIEKKAGEMGFLNDIRKVDDKPPSPLKQLFSWQTENLPRTPVHSNLRPFTLWECGRAWTGR
jgi:hypothetical protein